MSTQTYPHARINPNDPRLHTPEDEPKFRKPVAKFLYERGAVTKAQRVNQCGGIFRFNKHDQHVWRQNLGCCGLRCACGFCNRREARNNFNKYRLLAQSPYVSGDLTYLKMALPDAVTREQLRGLQRRARLLKRRIVSESPAAFIKQVWAKDDHATLQILYTGDVANVEEFRATFPEATVSTHPPDEFARLLMELCLMPLPESPEARADMEIMFHRVRHLDVSGVAKGDLRVYGVEAYTDKATVLEPCEHCKAKVKAQVTLCPTCGAKPTHVTKWFFEGNGPDEAPDDGWTPAP